MLAPKWHRVKLSKPEAAIPGLSVCQAPGGHLSVQSQRVASDRTSECRRPRPFRSVRITLESNALRTAHSNRAPKLCQTSKSLEIT
jgi:hypothetical protein